MTTWYFEYGTSTAYGSKTAAKSPGSGTSASTSSNLLAANLTTQVRAIATSLWLSTLLAAVFDMVITGIGLGLMMQVFVISVQNAVPRAVLGSAHPLASALAKAGFHATPRGLRLYREFQQATTAVKFVAFLADSAARSNSAGLSASRRPASRTAAAITSAGARSAG